MRKGIVTDSANFYYSEVATVVSSAKFGDVTVYTVCVRGNITFALRDEHFLPLEA